MKSCATGLSARFFRVTDPNMIQVGPKECIIDTPGYNFREGQAYVGKNLRLICPGHPKTDIAL
jgi:hypothetical protein